MVSIKWCCRQKSGIKLVEPNANLSHSYISLADASLGTMNREQDKNIVFSISAGYYSMYYSLYAVLREIGIKCEIHQCTLKLIEELLPEFYGKEEVKSINNAFKLRNIAQYYVDKILDKDGIKNLLRSAPDFVTKSKQVLNLLNEDKIKEIRTKLKNLLT
jgi:uncharacterized protein (UPF0332 family)